MRTIDPLLKNEFEYQVSMVFNDLVLFFFQFFIEGLKKGTRKQEIAMSFVISE